MMHGDTQRSIKVPGYWGALCIGIGGPVLTLPSTQLRPEHNTLFSLAWFILVYKQSKGLKEICGFPKNFTHFSKRIHQCNPKGKHVKMKLLYRKEKDGDNFPQLLEAPLCDRK